jgi:hypothetical protein
LNQEPALPDRRLLLYFSWSRPAETEAQLLAIIDRFPAIFELRRLFYPAFETLSDPAQVDQGIAGFLDHVQKANFVMFADLATTQGGRPTMQVERIADNGSITSLDGALLQDVDTVVVISFDSYRTAQTADAAEIAAVQHFLATPDHLIFICPHHEIGNVGDIADEVRTERQVAEHLHHGDRAIPPRQAFGGFARSLLAGLGLPVDNRFGLRPATNADGSPAPIDAEPALDRIGLLQGVETFNLHAHLPHLERTGEGLARMGLLARQRIDLSAPPHPFTLDGRDRFDALLQSTADAFEGTVLVSDTTLFSSTAGGVDNLARLWTNLMRRPARP